ncbi:MAG: phosphodiester glycosidase family protein [Actinomycetota bacterium]
MPGSGVTLRQTLGFANVGEAIGGGSVLVSDGVDVVGTCVGSGCRNPRTGVGVRAYGKLLLVVADGRQPKWSVGATMHEFAGILLQLGATDAMNLDGGGSSTVVVNGEVMKRPSDGEERRVSTAVLVLPGPDPGEPS